MAKQKGDQKITAAEAGSKAWGDLIRRMAESGKYQSDEELEEAVRAEMSRRASTSKAGLIRRYGSDFEQHMSEIGAKGHEVFEKRYGGKDSEQFKDHMSELGQRGAANLKERIVRETGLSVKEYFRKIATGEKPFEQKQPAISMQPGKKP